MPDDPRRAVLAAFLARRPAEGLALAIDAGLALRAAVGLYAAAAWARDVVGPALRRARAVSLATGPTRRRWKRDAAERVGRGTVRAWLEFREEA
jgi:hypothetical protein